MTTNSSKQLHQEVRLSFAPDISGEPIVCKLVRDYDIFFNILNAQIGPRKEGYLTLELIGLPESIEKGIKYLKSHGIKISALNNHICFDESLCMHCGMCTSVCKVEALYVENSTRLTIFDQDKCVACGLCTKICPVNAMHMDELYKSL